MTLDARVRPVQVGIPMLDGVVADLQEVRSRIAVLQAAEAELFARAVTVIRVREDERYRSGGAAIGHGSQLAVREVQAELAAACRVSEYTVARRLNQAHALFDRFAATGWEFACGRIDAGHVEAIVDIGADLSDDQVRTQYENVALEWAATETPTRLRGLLADLVTRLDPDGVEERVQDAVTRRRVTVRDLEPGLSRLAIDGPVAQIHGIHDRLTRIATELSGDNAGVQAGATGGPRDGDGDPLDDRTIAQLRADIAADLLLTGVPEGHGMDDAERARLAEIRGVVHIEMPAAILTGHAHGGAILPGHGPADSATARILAADAPTWTRIFRDPVTRVPHNVDTYRPSKKQKRLLRARDLRCRFPGCRRAARGPDRNADLDHTLAWADGGPTAIDNLAHLCRRHHTLKHDTDWTVQQLPGGILRWTAPTLRVHHDRPPGTVVFIPTEDDCDDPPPPF